MLPILVCALVALVVGMATVVCIVATFVRAWFQT